MREPNHPHDAFFKQWLSRPETARDFLTQHLPAELLAVIDLATLEQQKESFVDETLREHFSDILYRVRLAQGKSLLIGFLFEHKSYPDAWTRLQLLRYKVRAWEHELAKSGQITPMVGIVVYHGKVKWSSSKAFADLFELDGQSQERKVLQPYLPDFQHLLVDLSALSDEEIQGSVLLRVGELVLKHIFDPEFGQSLPEILQLLHEIVEQPTGLSMLMTLIRYIGKAGVGVSRQEMKLAVQQLLPKQGEMLMKTVAQEWAEDALKQGREEGLEQGRIETQRRMILQVLHHRFAPSPEVVERLREQLEQIKDEEVLSQLVDESLLTILLHDFLYKVEMQLRDLLVRRQTSQQAG